MKRTLLRPAFTLIELLVVVAIIGILIGLLVPAIQRIRESTRRTQCSNNVRQLSVAMLNYEAAHTHFPSGVVDDDDNLQDAIRTGWVVLLPLIEQAALFQQWDFDSDRKSAGNLALGQNSIAFLECPSNPGEFTQVGDFPGGKSDYAMSKGPSNALFAREVPVGMFDINSKVTFADISDGASNTFCIGEAASSSQILGRTP